MAVFENFPYTNVHELNLDWIIKVVKDYVAKTDKLEVNFNDLKEYVTNYFNSLDIQEEVNNKLQDMYDSGQLAVLIAQFLNTNSLLVFNTTADLVAGTEFVKDSTAIRLGDLTYNDGKTNLYKIRTLTSSDVIDGVNIIALTNFPTLIAELLKQSADYATPEMYGAKGDGVTDDTEALLGAIASGKTVIGYNSYSITETIEVKDSNRTILLNNLIVNGDVDAFVLEGSYNNINVNKITKAGNKAGTAFKMIKTSTTLPSMTNAHNNIKLGYIDNFINGLYLLASETGHGIQYNNISFDRIANTEYAIKLECLNPTTWVNSNTFNGGRIGDSVDYGVYTSVDDVSNREFDGNIFNNIGLEGITTTAITLSNATYNTFDNVRFAESFTGSVAINLNNSYLNSIEGDINIAQSQISSTNNFDKSIAVIRKNTVKGKLITNTPNGSWITDEVIEFNGNFVYPKANPSNIGFVNTGSARDITGISFRETNTYILVTSNETYTLPITVGNIVQEFYIECSANGAPTLVSPDNTTILAAANFPNFAYGAVYHCVYVPNRNWKAVKIN